jgi:4'-phosphopantetheinyl transferase
MPLQPHTIHVWIASLAITDKQAADMWQILSPLEQHKADRFRFPIHRLRYIAAHYHLRQTLSTYLDVSPDRIDFDYAEHKKPFLSIPEKSSVQFNLAHSGDLAIFGIDLTHPLGIDIEKIQDTYNIDIAERFFSIQEQEALHPLEEPEKRFAFYRIWARKEAMIKATGKGLAQSLSAFSVSVTDKTETITLDNQPWQLRSISVHPDYQAALATHPSITNIVMHHIDETLID